MKVLAIDDNNDNLVSLAAMLRSYLSGCQVETALSGKEGIDKARAFQPDAIILDIQMPIMDGFQTCRILKTDPTTQHIPVIFLTAQNTNPQSRIHGLEIGGDAFLAKPVEPGELMAQVRAMVRLKLAEDVLRQDKLSLEQLVAERTAALQASMEKYRCIVETSNEGIWVLDTDFGTTYVNRRMADILGYEPEELLGQAMVGLLFHEDLPDHERRMEGRRAGRSESYERRLRRKDGRECWCLISATPLRGPQGAVTGSFGMFTDITERKQLEAQLIHAQKMQAIGQLAGGVAHDFRNQLTVIKGYGEMLLRDSFSPEQARSLLEEVLRAADRATKVTGQLLSFSRKDMLQPEVVNLSQLVTQVAEHLGKLVGEDIRISITGGDRDCPVHIATSQFEQALMNLASNARDAMPGGGDLAIDVAPVDIDKAFAERNPDAKPGPYVRVTVRDAGSGMSKQTLARLFEPFFTTKKVGEGTGLGLPMVYGFVAQSGGFITVQSELGKGSTFELYFPRAGAAAESARPDAIAKPAKGGAETLLVVEDEEPIRRLLALGLEEIGYRVIETGNAREAIKLARSQADGIDMLITDVVMPGMNGIELARQIREARPGIPVLFVSGYGSRDLSRRGLDMERVEMIDKPFEHAEMVATVRRLLDKRVPRQPELQTCP